MGARCIRAAGRLASLPSSSRGLKTISPSAYSSDRKLGRFIAGAIAIGFTALMALGGAGGWALIQAQRQSAEVAHTYQVELGLQRFKAAIERVASARRGYLLTRNEPFSEILEEAARETETLLQHVGELTADNPTQGESLARLRELSERYVQVARDSVAAMREDLSLDGSAVFVLDSGAATVNAIRTLGREMIAIEQQLLVERTGSQRRQQIYAYAILAVAGLLMLLVGTVTMWWIRRSLTDLRRSHRTLKGLNEMLEGAVQVRTADLQRANDEIQRFAYIVSHDLRSPLVNVMGFTAELEAAIEPLTQMVDKAEAEAPQVVSEEARLAVREDLPESIGFIRTSTQKMDRLINAILRLSREGRRVITPEPLDMDEMMGSIVDSLQHRLDELGAEIAVEGPLPGVTSDRVAIEQIFSNLVENAVKYLKPGRPGRIAVRGRRVGDRIIYEVQDNGRGIDPKDHQRVFDLFRRSGAQDQPGEGIGLAHVRAVAYRLGGVISCDSALDEGATFRLSIPVRYEAQKEAQAS
ncbi:sensor histidine kinase [Aureimonas populi]|uniref:histidine kinase n=1 Tax=Aureimonas populi TaxID=1701758 RepID=A0ABW5CL62_9HYPH|nr:sensor histidine kinase [Aureimonas populi]